MKAVRIQDYNNLFIAERSELLKRISVLEADKSRDGEAISANSTEQAVDVQNDEVIDQLEEIEIKRLSEIDLALARIHNGSFGECVECGEQISDARLKAIPTASMCINCSEEDEV